MKVRRSRLLYHRTRLGLTQAELADLTGISLTTYQWLESGRRQTARASTLNKLMRLFDVDLEEIVWVADEVHPDDEPAEAS